MKIRSLHRETDVAVPLEEAFSFFRDPDNLLRITPDPFPVKMLNEGPIEMQEGTVIRLRLKLFKLFPVTWETRIEKWNPPYEFVDTQPKGPYRYWRHVHKFERIEKDRTRIIDMVDYAVPGWIFESVINWIMVSPQLRKLFDYRQKKYVELLGQPVSD